MEVERYYYAVASFMRKDDMVSGTVIVQSVIEISKQDYDAYKERIAKLHKIA